jgi:agmatine deiminase
VPTPAELGFRMPAEWEPHAATWIAWPHQRTDWPGKFALIPWVYVEIVRHLHAAEPVRILVQSAAARRQAERNLRRAGVDLRRIDFHEFRTDRVWTRDSGPIGVVRDRDGKRDVALTRWLFTAWRKYPNWKSDCQVPAFVGKVRALPVFDVILSDDSGNRHVVLEGGSIDVNGQGCLLTTEECLLSPVQERNPGLTRQDYERLFADYLGVRKVLWLGRGIAGDDTHGHVDDLARFVGPRTVVTVVEDDPADANYIALQENLERLRGMSDQDGRPLEVVPLPMPRPLFFDGQRLPASYANFYIANDRVLVPTFNDPNDRRALGILAELFPDRTALGIHAVDLVWGLGTLHCLTQQEPAGRPAEGVIGTPPTPP